MWFSPIDAKNAASNFYPFSRSKLSDISFIASAAARSLQLIDTCVQIDAAFYIACGCRLHTGCHSFKCDAQQKVLEKSSVNLNILDIKLL